MIRMFPDNAPTNDAEHDDLRYSRNPNSPSEPVSKSQSPCSTTSASASSPSNASERSLHQALLSHALNSFSGKDPSMNWPRCPKRTTSKVATHIHKASRSELQEWMRRENIVQQAVDRGYRPCFAKRTNYALPDAPAGTQSLMIGFIDDQGRLRMTTHCHLLPDLTIGASGLLDPTMLLLDDGTAYKWNQLP